MKKITILIYTLFCIQYFASAQAGDWTWIHGSSSSGSAGNYGTQGLSSPTNEPPAFYEACEWTDLNGNFWLFGGGYATYNDLWKYDPVSNEWTWMKGTHTTSDPGNYGVQGV